MPHKKVIKWSQGEAEKKLTEAGALVADANEIAEQISDLSKIQEQKLEAAQEDISDAYELLEE